MCPSLLQLAPGLSYLSEAANRITNQIQKSIFTQMTDLFIQDNFQCIFFFNLLNFNTTECLIMLRSKVNGYKGLKDH